MKNERVTLILINAWMDESHHYKRRLKLNIFFSLFFVFAAVLSKVDEQCRAVDVGNYMYFKNETMSMVIANCKV